MNTRTLINWEDFKTEMAEYCLQDFRDRKGFIFRGQASSDWELRTTLDRAAPFKSNSSRDDFFAKLMNQFQEESNGLIQPPLTGLSKTEWELLARHHGLPTPYLDWTQSPFVAAFFAFQTAEPVAGTSVAIWMLDRSIFVINDIPAVQLFDDSAEIRLNTRAIEQRCVFLRIRDADNRLEEYLDDGLTKFEVPATERNKALVELDEMLINARMLFRNLDGAAKIARWRMFAERMGGR